MARLGLLLLCALASLTLATPGTITVRVYDGLSVPQFDVNILEYLPSDVFVLVKIGTVERTTTSIKDKNPVWSAADGTLSFPDVESTASINFQVMDSDRFVNQIISLWINGTNANDVTKSFSTYPEDMYLPLSSTGTSFIRTRVFFTPTASPDCAVSTWSDWSPCNCTGWQTRTRDVTAPSATGGAACPALSEEQACAAPGRLDIVVVAHAGTSVPDLDSDTIFDNGVSDVYVRAIVGGVTQRTASLDSANPAWQGLSGAMRFNDLCDTTVVRLMVLDNDNNTVLQNPDDTFGLFAPGAAYASRSLSFVPRDVSGTAQLLCLTRSCSAFINVTITATMEVDCSVGDWGAWGKCACDTRTHARTRLVNLPPRAGGKACPTFDDSEPCVPPPVSIVFNALSGRNFPALDSAGADADGSAPDVFARVIFNNQTLRTSVLQTSQPEWTGLTGLLRFDNACLGGSMILQLFDQDTDSPDDLFYMYDDFGNRYQGFRIDIPENLNMTIRACLSPNCNSYFEFIVQQTTSPDCDVTEWTAWSACGCDAVAHRTRSVLIPSIPGGIDCGNDFDERAACTPPAPVTVAVTAQAAQNIPRGYDSGSQTDAFVRVLLGNTTLDSATVVNTNNPIWTGTQGRVVFPDVCPQGYVILQLLDSDSVDPTPSAPDVIVVFLDGVQYAGVRVFYTDITQPTTYEVCLSPDCASVFRFSLDVTRSVAASTTTAQPSTAQSTTLGVPTTQPGTTITITAITTISTPAASTTATTTATTSATTTATTVTAEGVSTSAPDVTTLLTTSTATRTPTTAGTTGTTTAGTTRVTFRSTTTTSVAPVLTDAPATTTGAPAAETTTTTTTTATTTSTTTTTNGGVTEPAGASVSTSASVTGGSGTGATSTTAAAATTVAVATTVGVVTTTPTTTLATTKSTVPDTPGYPRPSTFARIVLLFFNVPFDRIVIIFLRQRVSFLCRAPLGYVDITAAPGGRRRDSAEDAVRVTVDLHTEPGNITQAAAALDAMVGSDAALAKDLAAADAETYSGVRIEKLSQSNSLPAPASKGDSGDSGSGRTMLIIIAVIIIVAVGIAAVVLAVAIVHRRRRRAKAMIGEVHGGPSVSFDNPLYDHDVGRPIDSHGTKPLDLAHEDTTVNPYAMEPDEHYPTGTTFGHGSEA